nr:aminopeptidase N [Nocardioides agariphilus]
MTRAEAEERAALIEVDRYDVEVDLRGLFEGQVVDAVSTITFTCREPGASSFVDCVAQIRSATLNGVALDVSTASRGRLPLPDLQADNVLVVASSQSDTTSSSGIQRTVDPSDKLVYVWMSFECDFTRMVWANFDQPDLKAVHGFTVKAPDTWTVLNNSAPTGVDELADGGRLWTFADTPPLSTYVTVVNAGPFYERRSHRGGYDLGLYSRQSLKQLLDRDADELFEITEQGLAWYGEHFGVPFGQERYDQVFLPDLGGAMENWGCVTWGDWALPRSEPTYEERRYVADVVLHEMAHMWFGDLVTMKWWDDLWLNEAFASWAACWASVGATKYQDNWANFLAGEQLAAYRLDMGPASHPIRGDVPDVAQAMANFDAISYSKGQAVLKQLGAYVGEDALLEGLRAYFRDHAWGNTTLEDFVGAVATASGRDLGEWQRSWLDEGGTDTLTLSGSELTATGPDGKAPRPHRVDIGCYVDEGSSLSKVADVAVQTVGGSTQVELPESDLRLVNDGDLTFAAARTDPVSLDLLLRKAGLLPDAVSRSLAVSTVYDMLLKGELGAEETLACILGVLETEHVAGIVEPFLQIASTVAHRYMPLPRIESARSRVADVAAVLAGQPELAKGALLELAGNAVTPEHFARVDSAASSDFGLAWRVAATRAAQGDYDEAVIEDLLERDPDPDAPFSALAVRTARPLAEAKEEAWHALYVEQNVPSGLAMYPMVQAFWQPEQRDVVLPYTWRYLEEVPKLAGGLMLKVGGLIRGMFPDVGDQVFIDAALEMARADGCDPTVRGALLNGTDGLVRKLRARGDLPAG